MFCECPRISEGDKHQKLTCDVSLHLCLVLGQISFDFAVFNMKLANLLVTITVSQFVFMLFLIFVYQFVLCQLHVLTFITSD